MELKGETIIAAPRDRVWAALNDPAVLAACIDGVERLEPAGENRFDGTLLAKVGPVRGKFTGAVELTDVDPPNGYTIVGEGKGGVAGFAKGKAEVRLSEQTMDDGRTGTLLTYHASSTVGGKLAQLGARLIEGAAKGYAESFFRNFKLHVEDVAPTPATGVADAGTDAGADTEAGTAGRPAGLPPIVWGGLVVVAVAVFVALLLL